MNININKFKNYSPLILRLGLGFVFIWFGFSALFTPGLWLGLVPTWTHFLGAAKTLVLIHGLIEIIGGLLLCAGFKIRIVSTILFLSLIATISRLTFGPVMVRDLGLTVAMISIFLTNE